MSEPGWMLVRDTLLGEVKTVLREMEKTTLEPRVATPAAVQLLMLTAAVESGFREVAQRGNGPAVGLFQVEPATALDVRRYARMSSMWRWLWVAQMPQDDLPKSIVRWTTASVIVARLHYWRVPEPLPRLDDWKGLATYWKEYWNTSAGKGTVARAMRAVDRYGLRELEYD